MEDMFKEREWKIGNAIVTKIIYGTLSTTLIFRKEITKVFRGQGLIINSCELCAWNREAYNKQLTMIFHSDNLFISHIRSNKMIEYATFLGMMCGTNDALIVTW